jgi:hypothetical protein
VATARTLAKAAGTFVAAAAILVVVLLVVLAVTGSL